MGSVSQSEYRLTFFDPHIAAKVKKAEMAAEKRKRIEERDLERQGIVQPRL